MFRRLRQMAAPEGEVAVYYCLLFVSVLYSLTIGRKAASLLPPTSYVVVPVHDVKLRRCLDRLSARYIASTACYDCRSGAGHR